MTARIKSLQSELRPPLSAHEASVESDRCYFCYDAPCQTACPTGIDIPLFIRQISSGNPKGAAKTIFDENILGGMCARDCPTETLCEQVCVRNVAEEQPVRIGELQRFATDSLMATGTQPYARASATGKQVAVVGAGPAGLSCAHRLALHGHSVTLFEANDKPGGLNEYGIAAYKTVDNFAQREVDYILSIGGIKMETGKALGVDITLQQLIDDFDAVFLGIGLGSVNTLGIEGAEAAGVDDAVDFISSVRQLQADDGLPMQRRVVVIGGGMTAIDAAMQSRLLGAEDVTIAYRRGIDNMNASQHEQDLAQTHGITIKPWLQPLRVIKDQNTVTGVEFEYTAEQGGKLSGTGETITLPCDRVFKAIGQAAGPAIQQQDLLPLENGRVPVNDERRSSHPKIWAGGDCINLGEDLTVAAVQDGKVAAESIHAALM